MRDIYEKERVLKSGLSKLNNAVIFIHFMTRNILKRKCFMCWSS